MLACPVVTFAADHAAAGLAPYLDGLEALRAGNFAQAERSFQSALDASGSDPRMVLALGVAQTAAERFDLAVKTLGRFSRLGGRGREAQLWSTAAAGMGGDVYPGGGLKPPRSLQKQVPAGDRQCESGRFAVPGHLIQGSKNDYPTDYASFVIDDYAQAHVQARCDGRLRGNAALDAARNRAASWFANRMLVDPDLAPAHRAKAHERAASGRWSDVLLYAGFARRAYPDDPGMIYLMGRAWLELGRAQTARSELTIALTLDTRMAAAYRERARAAALLGDGERAAADLALAAELGDAGARDARARIATALPAAPSAAAVQALRERLVDAANDGADEPRLDAAAVALQRAAGARRLRYDEGYQNRLRILEAAVRAAPKDVATHIALATHLADEADLRGETVEPRRPQVAWRWQRSRESELERAVTALDAALAIDSRSVKAMLTKASVLARLQRDGEAEQLADRALKLAPDDPEALALYAYYKARRANAMNAQAAALRSDDCSSSSRTETRYDGVWEVTTTTCHPPTQSELAQAAALDRQAEELRRRARQAVDRALKATAGTYLGHLLEADVAQWSRDLSAAAAALERAIALDASDPRAQDELARVYARMGDADRATEQRLAADRFYQTTAAPLLRRAWARIGRTDQRGAQADLERAARIDPTDARAAAYLGAAFEAQGQPGAAAVQYRIAAALERARLAADDPQTAPPARHAAAFATAIAANARLAALAAERRDWPAALVANSAITALVPRFEPGWQSVEMFGAMLPGERDPSEPPPAPRNAASLIASAWAGSAEALRALGRQPEAVAALEAATALGPVVGRAKIGSADAGSNYAGEADAAAGDARVALAAERLKAGDIAGAQETLSGIGYGQLTEQGRREANLLQNSLAKLLSRQQSAQQANAGGQYQAQDDARRAEQERGLRQRYQQRIDVLRARGMHEHADAEQRELDRQLAALSAPPPDARGSTADAAALLSIPGVTASRTLVGEWTLQPQAQWRYMPGAGRLRLNGNGRFVFWSDGAATQSRQGRWGAMQDAQLFLVYDDGEAATYYIERRSGDDFVLMTDDAVSYDVKRR